MMNYNKFEETMQENKWMTKKEVRFFVGKLLAMITIIGVALTIFIMEMVSASAGIIVLVGCALVFLLAIDYVAENEEQMQKARKVVSFWWAGIPLIPLALFLINYMTTF